MSEKRDFDPGPDFREVEIERSRIRIKAVDGNMLFVDQDRPADPIEVRGIPYRVTCHLSVVDGEVTVHGQYGISAHRMDSFSDASPAARRRLEEICVDAGHGFLAEHSEDLNRAHAAQTSNAIMHLDKDVERLSSELDEKMRERDALLREEASIRSGFVPAPRI